MKLLTDGKKCSEVIKSGKARSYVLGGIQTHKATSRRARCTHYLHYSEAVKNVVWSHGMKRKAKRGWTSNSGKGDGKPFSRACYRQRSANATFEKKGEWSMKPIK